MAKYRSTLSDRSLNFTDSGGPLVGPGEEFAHDGMPDALRCTLLRSGFIVEVPAPVIDDAHVHESRELFERLETSGRK